jgi:hypothetical protein
MKVMAMKLKVMEMKMTMKMKVMAIMAENILPKSVNSILILAMVRVFQSEHEHCFLGMEHEHLTLQEIGMYLGIIVLFATLSTHGFRIVRFGESFVFIPFECVLRLHAVLLFEVYL